MPLKTTHSLTHLPRERQPFVFISFVYCEQNDEVDVLDNVIQRTVKSVTK